MESPAQHRLALARELLDDIELSRLGAEAMLLKVSRLARMAENSEMLEWIDCELGGYSSPLSPTADKYFRAVGRLTDEQKAIGYWRPFASLLGWVRAMEMELQGLKVPDVNFSPTSANPQEFVVGMFGQHVQSATAPVQTVVNRMSSLTKDIAELREIVAKVTALLHRFISNTYYELSFRGLAESIFDAHKRDVDARLAGIGSRAFERIPAIAERLAAGDNEAVSQAMTTARRVLAAFADAIQPSTGAQLQVGIQLWEAGPEHYLNRLRYYVTVRCPSERRRQRLSQTISSLNARFSAGTHADVALDEAKALFVLLYVTLGEVLSLKGPTESKTGAIENRQSEETL
jgi:hypothetical protein